jgi:hypothetical protein
MKNDWIIDVLADLNSFAKSNGLPELAKQLEETAILASVELASHSAGASNGEPRPTFKHDFQEPGRRVGS